jgi:hypothetical protein
MKHLHIFIYIGALLAVLSLASCSGCSDTKAEEKPKMESVILSRIRQKADLVTTEVRVRKLAIYDSSKHEKFELKDPRTWKYGERKCIVPVDVTIKYGYDLRDLTIDDVKLTDDSTAVVILLPEPKVIDSGYEAKVEEGQVVRMSSGMRDRISHEEVDQLMEQAYRAVMKEDFSEMVERDIEQNAKVVFEAIVKGIGMKNVEVVVHKKDDWKLKTKN